MPGAAKPSCAMCHATCLVPLCGFCRNIWILGTLALAHMLYYVLDYYLSSDK